MMNLDLINMEIKNRIYELISIIYNNYDCVGGALHLLIDNQNLRDEDIKWCINNSISKIRDNKERQIYLECARLLLKLSYSSRCRLIIYGNKRYKK
ncbi:hypothetical protein DVV91_10115 [Clostridium botulinum]|uniref:hypothetical protein n=1 Tax=Clostridium botulinum TaxID=1491 RepID=UPI001967249A|nr:hypothetical protein [Clostridium botulinum]MBN1074696.1 hypothetical protein [Clostridium botulinum]